MTFTLTKIFGYKHKIKVEEGGLPKHAWAELDNNNTEIIFFWGGGGGYQKRFTSALQPIDHLETETGY